jgi:hypothetical protein
MSELDNNRTRPGPGDRSISGEAVTPHQGRLLQSERFGRGGRESMNESSDSAQEKSA